MHANISELNRMFSLQQNQDQISSFHIRTRSLHTNSSPLIHAHPNEKFIQSLIYFLLKEFIKAPFFSPAHAGGQLKSKNGQKYIINHRNDGFFITKKHIFLIAVLIAIVMAAVFLLTYYLLAHRWVTRARFNRFNLAEQWFKFRMEWQQLKIELPFSSAVKETVWEEETVQMRSKQLASWVRMERRRQKQLRHQQLHRLRNQ